MSGTGGTHVVSGARGGLGAAMVRALHGCGLRVRGVNSSGKADAPAGVNVLAADLSSGSRRDRTRNTASQ